MNSNKWIRELSEFLSFQSISTDSRYSEEVAKTAQWLVNHFQSIGLHAELIEIPGGHPLVYAEKFIGEKAPTILICGHYDVQPPDPLEEWVFPPFTPTIKDGKIFARGASDSKGQLFAYIKGLESLLEENKLAVNVKFLIEGEEESNGKSMLTLLRLFPDDFEADSIVYAGGVMVNKDAPGICCGARGLLAAEIEISGSETNLHSGTFGGKVLNSAIILSRILSKTASAKFWQTIGSSFDVNSLQSGYPGNGFQFIIPAKAFAKVSFRLISGQDPNIIMERFQKFVDQNVPMGIKATIRKCDEASAVLLSRDSKIFKAACVSLKKVFNHDPLWYIDLGSVPILCEFKKLNPNLIMVGFGLDDDNLHAPNEKLDLENFFRGVEFTKELLKVLGYNGG